MYSYSVSEEKNRVKCLVCVHIHGQHSLFWFWFWMKTNEAHVGLLIDGSTCWTDSSNSEVVGKQQQGRRIFDIRTCVWYPSAPRSSQWHWQVVAPQWQCVAVSGNLWPVHGTSWHPLGVQKRLPWLTAHKDGATIPGKTRICCYHSHFHHGVMMITK